MRALWRLLAGQPQLLADHAEAYVELVVAEAGSASQAWRQRLWLSALALCAMVVAAVLAGVAVMLWAVTTPAGLGHAWILIVVPLLPLAAALRWLQASRRAAAAPAFAGVRQQMNLDMAMLRETRAPGAE